MVEKQVQKAVRRAKKNFERNLAKNAKKGDPKAFYSYLNSCTANKTSVGPLKDGDKVVSDSKEMASVLNSFFSSVFTEEDTSIIPEPRQTFDGGTPLEDVTFGEDAIRKKIMNLRKGSAPGPDHITPTLLQETSDAIVRPLAIIFAKSLAEGIVPDDWRCANITPIFKKGSKSSAGNYRPVSLTSVVCKIMESVIKDTIVAHLSASNIIAPSQHGFMPGRSCLTNLLEYLNKLTDIIDSGESADIVYLDFAKAFDKVPHKRLLAKLSASGINGNVLKWIEAWLTDRKQRVVLNGQCSDWDSVLSGVPQDSVLGPVLFIIFINDIDDATSPSSSLWKFADDTKSVQIIANEEDQELMQADINSLNNWADTWQMLFNADKCKVMHIGKNNPGFSYTMGGHAPAGTVLEVTTCEKDLGILVHSSLKPSAQCAAAAKKANSVLGQMSRSLTYRDKDTWLKLYRMYIRPHLENCAQAWSPWTEADIDLIESVQRRAIRMTSDMKGNTYEERLTEAKMFTLQQRRLRGDMIEVWKLLHGHEKVDVSAILTPIENYSQRSGMRSSNQLMLAPAPRARLEIKRNFFSHRVVMPWNSLPFSVKNSDSIDAFKRSYDAYVISTPQVF